MSVEISVVYEGNLRCVATHGPSGATLATDAPLDNGGRGSAFSPTDLVATALGTCVITTMGLVAARHQIDLTGIRVRVTKEMVQQPVRRIASLVTEIIIPAAAVSEPSMRRRLEAAADHCPVHASLHPDVRAPLNFTYE
ncbi:MAG: OsmC family protein [Planctomycetaceae bacterium]